MFVPIFLIKLLFGADYFTNLKTVIKITIQRFYFFLHTELIVFSFFQIINFPIIFVCSQ